MRHGMLVVILGFALSVPVFASAHMDIGFDMLVIPGAIVYTAGFILDARSTMACGRNHVKRYETSPLFSRMAGFGFPAAVAVQAGTEVLLAVVVLPVLFGGLNAGMSGMFLVLFGAVHLAGWLCNRTPRSIAFEKSDT